MQKWIQKAREEEEGGGKAVMLSSGVSSPRHFRLIASPIVNDRSRRVNERASRRVRFSSRESGAIVGKEQTIVFLCMTLESFLFSAEQTAGRQLTWADKDDAGNFTHRGGHKRVAEPAALRGPPKPRSATCLGTFARYLLF